MRVLIAIPHFFQPDGRGLNASNRADPQPRLEALARSLRLLHSLFGPAQHYFQREESGQGLELCRSNEATSLDLAITICTTRGLHLLDPLAEAQAIPDRAYDHVALDCEPLELGLGCHAHLRDRLVDRFDYYCFLEDDLLIHDPYFFVKQAWFHAQLGDRAVLQPNRYELSQANEFQKIYIDPDFESQTGRNPGYAHNFTDHQRVQGRFLGQELWLERARDPHSGCFFLTHRQMSHWASRRYFLDGDRRFIGPLESAASLGIMKAFRVYKPAMVNANFLEIQHFGDWNSRFFLENRDTVVFKRRSVN